MGIINNAGWNKLGVLWIDFQARCINLELASISSMNNMFERVSSVCARPISNSMCLNDGVLTEEQFESYSACNQQWIEDYSNLIQVYILLQWELNDWSDQFARAWVNALTSEMNINRGELHSRSDVAMA